MVADRAFLRRCLAHMDMAAVGALPDLVAVPGEHQTAFHIGQELTVALLVLFLNGAYSLEQGGNLMKALFFATLANSAYISVHS